MAAAWLWTGLQGQGLMLTTPEPPPGSTGTFRNLAPSSLGCPILLKLSPSPKRHPKAPRSCVIINTGQGRVTARSPGTGPGQLPPGHIQPKPYPELGLRACRQTGRGRVWLPRVLPHTPELLTGTTACPGLPGTVLAHTCLNSHHSEPSSSDEPNWASSAQPLTSQPACRRSVHLELS